MEPPDPSFADEISVLQEYAVFDFDILKTDFSFPFEVHRPWILVEASLIAVLNTCFELTEEGPEEAQDSSVANLPKPC